ncbi:host cell division inhibitor Icd-like protein [Klebsiella quasipneumoniae]
MSDKTKAALQSCQCHYEIFKQSQDITLIVAVNYRAKFCAQWVIVILVDNSLFSWQSVKLRFAPNPDLAYERVVPQSHEVNRLSLSESDSLPTDSGLVRYLCGSLSPAQNTPEIIVEPPISVAPHSANEISPVQLSGSDLAFLRWRRLISPLIEATTKPAVLSPSSFTFSSSPINFNGTLETICCDLLFLEPVAMSAFPFDWWHSVYAKKNNNQGLKVAFTLFYGKCMPPVKVRHKWQRPGVLGTTTEASNHNVIGANTMACIQHTQTRPKYQYRFLALNRHDKKAKPCRLSVEAATEREARSILAPHFILSLAARLPVQEVRHV